MSLSHVCTLRYGATEREKVAGKLFRRRGVRKCPVFVSIDPVTRRISENCAAVLRLPLSPGRARSLAKKLVFTFYGGTCAKEIASGMDFSLRGAEFLCRSFFLHQSARVNRIFFLIKKS